MWGGKRPKQQKGNSTLVKSLFGFIPRIDWYLFLAQMNARTETAEWLLQRALRMRLKHHLLGRLLQHRCEEEVMKDAVLDKA